MKGKSQNQKCVCHSRLVVSRSVSNVGRFGTFGPCVRSS